jgi:opacity protein-like surface antigen
VAFRRTLVTAIALLWSAPGGATDLRLSLGAEGEYDSNIFRRETDIEDDFVILAVPAIQLLETEGKFTYDVGYTFPYQHSIKTNALRDFNHVVRTGADYHLSDRTQFSFSDRFSYTEGLSNNFDQTPTVGEDFRQNILRNHATLGAAHRFTPRLSSHSTFGQEIFRTTQDNRSDNRSYSLGSGLDYMLTERQTLSGGVQSTYQDFDQSDDDPESHTIFVGPYLAWSYQIDEQSHLRISAGPTYVYSKREADPSLMIFSSDSDSRVAGLGDFSIDRRWTPTMLSGFSYQRRQDTASGVAGSAILDAVALTHTWAVTERWTLAGRADWTRRKSATSVETGNDDLDTQRWGAGAMASYRITRNLTGSVRYQYSKQRSKSDTAGRFSDFDGHVATLGFNYALDPIEVW